MTLRVVQWATGGVGVDMARDLAGHLGGAEPGQGLTQAAPRSAPVA